jgi:hypothetical protein
MVINNNNLSISIHCGNKPVAGYASDVLYVTESGTLALNGPYSVAVSALQKEPGDNVGCMTVEIANSLSVIDATNVSPSLVTPLVADKIPPTDKLVADKPVLFEMFINANILAKIIQSAIDFDSKGVLRLQFVGQHEPMRIDCRDMATGQRWEAFLMPRIPQLDAARFAEPEPEPCKKGCQYSKDVGMWPEHRCSGECVYAEPEPEMSDFDKAMAEAMRLA